MLPSVVANELTLSINEFLRNAFPIATPFFQQSHDGNSVGPTALVDELIQREGGVFKGPYLDIKLPFRRTAAPLPFKHLSLPFQPFRHQHVAFNRLTSEQPKSTIIATGTGSGKTECFMLPVIEDSVRRRIPGVKTIIVYPMNALAADQARRFAAEVSKLETRITVGMYVGGDKHAAVTGHMDEQHVITDREVLRQNPPDILLTNYKMLDFLLIRPEDKPLWRFNEPGVLKYLVVDELHTFDGAQGTDLACLIRRLRDRLGAGEELACVGTSATMGSGGNDLLNYARNVFAAHFEDDALITEDRVSVNEYLQRGATGGLNYFHWPDPESSKLDPHNYDSAGDYVYNQAILWFPEVPSEQFAHLASSTTSKEANNAAARLGQVLKQHQAFHELLRIATDLVNTQEITEAWQRRFNLTSTAFAEQLLSSLISLVSAARKRIQLTTGERFAPFLHVRHQVWLRELRRMVSTVPKENEGPPKLVFADDLSGPKQAPHLPVVHCRECNFAAWGGVTQRNTSRISSALQSFYQEWFSRSSRALLIVPRLPDEPKRDGESRFCPGCLEQFPHTAQEHCQYCQEKTIPVWIPLMSVKRRYQGKDVIERDNRCPECRAKDSLMIVGYQAATLIGVMMGKLFGTQYNDDKKLIAFSDSVQDAAHRAGFLGANNWRMLLRNAFATWLNEQETVSLHEMQEQLPAFWREQLGTPERFSATFMPPDKTWFREYQELVEHGRLAPGNSLPDDVSSRLSWEVLDEFGRRSTIGRSLERTGTAAVAVDLAELKENSEALAARLAESIEAFRNVSVQAIERFIVGWVHHVRSKGAVYNPLLNSYIASRGDSYLLARIPWMPGFGHRSHPPAAITLVRVSKNFEALTGDQQTWYSAWLQKTLAPEYVLVSAEAREVYSQLLRVLEKAGWLYKRDSDQEPIYLLKPERLYVTTDVYEARCSTCRHAVYLPAPMRHAYSDLPCFRAACNGHFTLVGRPNRTPTYGRTAPHRLVPHEHTGLLSRELREQVEHSFINGKEPWDYNLLSATPTLEMGIDIGDLSTVFLCSVPPAQANYIQRIGRAGRRDGNSLAVTVANGRNHDLYFFSEPEEMMIGEVATPGVFLQAQAVLERQLMAYCFDRWTATSAEVGAIPRKLQAVLNSVEQNQAKHFPFTLFSYIHGAREEILDTFFAMFPDLNDEARHYLREFLNPESEHALERRLLKRLLHHTKERKNFRRQIDQLKRKIDREKKLPSDEVKQDLIKQMGDERTALMGLLSGINNRATLNFLTDEGVLPNYAFPEEGVTLQSVILGSRDKTEGEDGAYKRTVYTFQRPAQAALSELAPESKFYAVNHKLSIDRVDLALSEPEMWRFCDRCHYSADVTVDDPHSACPKCGSAQWANVGQKHEVLRLRQVYSTEQDRASRIGDDSEQREPVFFNRQLLVNIPAEGHRGGWRLKSQTLPFGFEYLQRATFREVNFGVAGGDTKAFHVAGEELPRRGFHICRHCGTVQKARPTRRDKPHAFTCKLFDDPSNATSDDFLQSLYLYRELESEAVRILLPLSEVAYSETDLNSFVAALNLGLKLHFHGDVRHLQVTQMKEPATTESSERVFLVLYDRIPGGTGYLKELMREPGVVFDLLASAHTHLLNCVCAEDNERDGCYRCLLAYRDSRHMHSISRRAAAQLLSDILAERNAIETIGNLGDVNTNPLVESKLEQLFIEALGNLPNAQLSKEIFNGKPGYRLTIPGADGRIIAWHVEHQKRLGPVDGVQIPTIADVLLTPVRQEPGVRPIAIYMDGIRYHRNIVDDDVLKRMAIISSGNYWVVSLSKWDLSLPDRPPEPIGNDVMYVSGPQERIFQQVKTLAKPKTRSRTGMDLLNAWLRAPNYPAEEGFERAFYQCFALARSPQLLSEEQRNHVLSDACAGMPTNVIQEFSITNSGMALGGISPSFTESSSRTNLFVAVPFDDIKAVISGSDSSSAVRALRCHVSFNDQGNSAMSDDFRDDWRAFWNAANQLQFLPGFSMATMKLVENEAFVGGGDAPAVQELHSANAGQTTPQIDVGGWQEVRELSALSEELLAGLQNLGIPVPEVGVDIPGAVGSVALSGNVAELVWRAQKIVVSTGEDGNLAGWTVVLSGEDMIEQLKRLQKEGAFE